MNSLCFLHATLLGDIISACEHDVSHAAHVVLTNVGVVIELNVIAHKGPRVVDFLGLHLFLLALLRLSLVH